MKLYKMFQIYELYYSYYRQLPKIIEQWVILMISIIEIAKKFLIYWFHYFSYLAKCVFKN